MDFAGPEDCGSSVRKSMYLLYEVGQIHIKISVFSLKSWIVLLYMITHVDMQNSLCHLHISNYIVHLICPHPKSFITFVFHFSWVLQLSQEKLKTMLMQNFGGQIRCFMGDVQGAYECFLSQMSL